MSKEILQEVLRLYELGMSIIPVKRDKSPFIDWRPYMTERADARQIKEWFEPGNDIIIPPNIGIITGKISKIVVLDLDWQGIEWEPLLGNTVVSQTPHGKHYYYKYPETPIYLPRFISPAISFCSDERYVIAPPSEGAEGGKYKWLISPYDSEFAEFPFGLLEI